MPERRGTGLDPDCIHLQMVAWRSRYFSWGRRSWPATVSISIPRKVSTVPQGLQFSQEPLGAPTLHRWTVLSKEQLDKFAKEVGLVES